MDYASATPVRKEVTDIMNTYAYMSAYNPSSLYAESRHAKEKLDDARKLIALSLNTTAGQIVCTSGGTESNNLALLGVFEYARQQGIHAPHIISCTTEHPAIREVLVEIERRGGKVTLIAPESDGRIAVQHIHDALTPDTVLISVMHTNNEIGVIQPIREIVQKVKAYKLSKNKIGYPYVHTDACQTPLWQGIDVSTLGIDLLSLDGLKIGGPRGSGCVYIKGGTHIHPVMYGGGQEQGLRSGTEHVVSILGFATALSLAKKEHKALSHHTQTLRDMLWKNISADFPTCTINGSIDHRAPNNLNVCFPGVDAEHLVVALDVYGVCVSYSSSCRTLKEDSSSYVVEALNPACKHSSIRFTLGKETTEKDIIFVREALRKAMKQVIA